MLLFNGSRHNRTHTFNRDIYHYVYEQCEKSQLSAKQIDLSEMEIPHFDPYAQTAPDVIQNMLELFLSEDKQIWLAPLYHGGIPGIMKNALDWLQLTSKDDAPYLTDKIIGLICVADGLFAIQGINTMNTIAHSLRAWVLPFTIPINKSDTIIRKTNRLSPYFRKKIDMMIQMLKETEINRTNLSS